MAVMKKKYQVYLANIADSNLVSNVAPLLTGFYKSNSTRNDVEFIDNPDSANFIVFFQMWSFKLPEYGTSLLQDDFFRHYCQKIYVVNYDDIVGEGFLPGCYTSLKLSCYNPKRFIPCSYPATYNEVLDGCTVDSKENEYLFWFRGTMHSSEIRPKLLELYKNEERALIIDNSKSLHSHSTKEKAEFIEEMRSCSFVLCPKGFSPSTYRIFESMSMGKCPVVISDEWVEPIGPKWSECSIRIKERDLPCLVEILESYAPRAYELGCNARLEWEKHFSGISKNQGYLNGLIALYESAEPATKKLCEYRRYWRSHKFMRNNGWLLRQRLKRKIDKFFV